MARRSLPQIVDARMATTTWPGPGVGSATSRRSTCRPPGRNTPFTSFAPRDPDRLRLVEQHVVDELDALHGRVVHVADLVEPGAEPTARPDVLRPEPRLDGAQRRVPGDRGHGVGHVRRAQPGGHDEV